jgi:hypothetical protein
MVNSKSDTLLWASKTIKTPSLSKKHAAGGYAVEKKH